MKPLIPPPTVRFLIAHPAHFFALGFGSGLARFAPGTAGSLVALPIAWGIATFPLLTQLSIVAILFIIGCYICAITSRNLGVVDHGSIVWDEIVAMLLVLAFTPLSWLWWLIAFLLFRLFDIWKPYPIKHYDAKLKNGFGVMFDDLLAGIYALICIQILLWMTKNLSL
ncbi:MAG: phosphatidylglycerophosphatase A [Methylotenera sp.]|nr:MAG: phosphatidylglycerophosphatase A [Methylotenera sp.]